MKKILRISLVTLAILGLCASVFFATKAIFSKDEEPALDLEETPESAPEINEVVISEGLEFISNGDGTCYVSGIGTFDGDALVVPSASPSGERVLSIGPSALKKCANITSVTLPEGVVSVDAYAFSECSNLKSVTLSDSVLSVDDTAFRACRNLESVAVGSGLNKITYAMFMDCDKLSSIKISAENTYYKNVDGNDVYTANGENLLLCVSDSETYHIPDGVKLVSSNAFSLCDSLVSLTMSDSVLQISHHAFYGCSSLASLNIGSGVTMVYTSAFDECENLDSITVDVANTNYKSVDGDLYSGDGKTLSRYAPGKKLVSFAIPSGVTKIDDRAFSGNTYLTSITIPNDITEVGEAAFEGCANLIEVEDDVSYVGKWAVGSSAIDIASLRKDTIGIANHCFISRRITAISLPDTVMYIGAGAFNSCSLLQDVSLGTGLVSIGDNAFAGSGVENIVMPTGLTSIGDYAFGGCRRLKSVSIPGSVTEMGSQVFYYAENLETVNIGSGIKAIVNSTFVGCSSLGEVTIPGSVEYIDANAFKDCTALTNVVIMSGCKSIAINAFANCTSLITVTIPNTVIEIGRNAFDACSSLVDVYYDGSESEWNMINMLDNNDWLQSATKHYA